MAKRPKAMDPALPNELLTGQDPKTVLSSKGLLDDLKKALGEPILNAEKVLDPGDDRTREVRHLTS
jgi:hypothetical protein